MPSLWTCGLSPGEHLSKYFGAGLDWDVDTQRIQTGSSLENILGDFSDDELFPADMLLPITETKTVGKPPISMRVNYFHGHDLFLEWWFSIGVISQVPPFMWLVLSCPQFCLLYGSNGCLTKGIFKFQVAACELLHGIVTYMLGKASQMPEGRQGPPPMYHLHKRVFPVLLRLACDIDQVSRFICMNFSLFKYLWMWELIVWFRCFPNMLGFFPPDEEYFVGWNSILGMDPSGFCECVWNLFKYSF